MRVKLARTAGFCMGVRRAMDIAQEAAAEGGGPIYTHGPLVHNRQAVEVLADRGVRPADHPEDLPPGRLVTRAHGIPPAERDRLQARGFTCIDATCPHVLQSQRRIERAERDNLEIVLVGDRDHAEVIGLAGHVERPVHIISTPEEARNLPIEGRFIVLAQTTFNAATYEQVSEILRQRYPDTAIVYDSICRATEERQAEARDLAQACDAMVVVGGRHSANTRRLAEVAAESGKPVFHVETADELDVDALKHFREVGVTAGASTPGWVTQAVIHRLQTVAAHGLRPRLAHLVGLAVKSYLLTAIGAACLTHLITRLLRVHPVPWEAFFIVFAYVFTAHTMNRRFSAPPSAGELPPFDAFFAAHRLGLYALSAALALSSLLLAATTSRAVLILLGLAYLGGIAYAMPLLPRGFRRRRLKDIPASKDLFTAVAWAVVVVGVPALPVLVTSGRPGALPLLGAGLLVFLLVFGKTVAQDLRDTEGDRLIGSETLPVFIGTHRTLRLLYALQGLALVLLLALVVSGAFPTAGLFVAVLPAYATLYLRLFPKGLLTEEVRCQALLDGQLLVAGLLSVLWGLAPTYG